MSDKEKPCYTNSTIHGWNVEARVATDRPLPLGDQIFDERWRFVSFSKVRPPFGVPNSSLYANVLDSCGLYGYETAQALRWWLHASAPFLCGLETRLVSYEVTSNVKWTRDGEQDVVGERVGLKMPVPNG